MENISFTLKDILYILGFVVTVGGIYWKLIIRIVKLEGTKDDLNKKVDILLLNVDNLKSLIGEHIAYHKGKEDQK